MIMMHYDIQYQLGNEHQIRSHFKSIDSAGFCSCNSKNFPAQLHFLPSPEASLQCAPRYFSLVRSDNPESDVFPSSQFRVYQCRPSRLFQSNSLSFIIILPRKASCLLPAPGGGLSIF